MVWVGLRPPLAALEQIPHILFRQALILRLRVLTPIIFFVGFVTGFGLIFQTYNAPYTLLLRITGEGLLICFILLALFGTVPINKSALTWDPKNPPLNWLAQIRLWEKLDLVRCILAFLAFSVFICATVADN